MRTRSVRTVITFLRDPSKIFFLKLAADAARIVNKKRDANSVSQTRESNDISGNGTQIKWSAGGETINIGPAGDMSHFYSEPVS